MINRRLFIQAGALSAVPLVAGSGLLLAPGRARAETPGFDLHTVVYDERFPESVAFAEEARRLGQRTSAIRGDVTGLWYDDLYHRWRQGAAAIAGLTTPEALFCLEIFGNDAGLRLHLKTRHQPRDARIEHRLEGPRPAFARSMLRGLGGDWSRQMARAVVGCPASREGRQVGTLVSAAGRGEACTQGTLVSWLLVPRQAQT